MDLRPAASPLRTARPTAQATRCSETERGSEIEIEIETGTENETSAPAVRWQQRVRRRCGCDRTAQPRSTWVSARPAVTARVRRTVRSAATSPSSVAALNRQYTHHGL